MELIQWKNKTLLFIKQNKYVLLIALVGLILLIPTGNKVDDPVISEATENIVTLEQQLSRVLSAVEGAGKVEVRLTQAAGEEILYQIDRDYSTTENGSDEHADTVIVSGNDRAEVGLVRQVNPPVYLGAIILCQGGDDPKVRLAIVEAVSRATGLGADRISVLKME